MGWSDVTGWVGQGGAFLGIKRTLPEGKYPAIAARLRQYNIQALLVIGGFEVRFSFNSAFTFIAESSILCFTGLPNCASSG